MVKPPGRLVGLGLTMRIPLVAALVLLPALLLPVAHGEPGSVTVTLQVNAGVPDAPAWRDCAVTIAEGGNVGDVLDQAVAQGCILEWSANEFPGFGRYVTSIDYVSEAVVTFWAFRVDGAFATLGIDQHFPSEGETILFTYEEWPVPLS